MLLVAQLFPTVRKLPHRRTTYASQTGAFGLRASVARQQIDLCGRTGFAQDLGDGLSMVRFLLLAEVAKDWCDPALGLGNRQALALERGRVIGVDQ